MKRLILLVLVFLAVAGCSSQEKEGIDIVVSVSPFNTFVEKVSGENVNVHVMVPPGATPHTYEPSPKKLRMVSKADMYVMVGSGIGFEKAWFDKIRSVNPDMNVINSSKGIELDKSLDPHVWTSPENAIKIVENIRDGVSEIDEENKESYHNNTAKYVNKLKAMDKEIRSSINNDKFIVYHPAWGYFAKEYNLSQIAVQRQGKNPTARIIEDVVKTARKNNITVIFASPQFSSRSAEIIAKEIEGEVAFVDPLKENYAENIMEAAEAFT